MSRSVSIYSTNVAAGSGALAGNPGRLRTTNQSILGPFGQDCDLRCYGEKIATQGGKVGKKRAVIAVARKRAVLMHHLWLTGQIYKPLHLANQQEAAKTIKQTNENKQKRFAVLHTAALTTSDPVRPGFPPTQE